MELRFKCKFIDISGSISKVSHFDFDFDLPQNSCSRRFAILGLLCSR